MRLTWLHFVLAAVTVGCSASNTSGGEGGSESETTTASGGAGGGGAATTTTSDTTGVGGGFGSGGGGTGGDPNAVAEVYGHSPDVLYKLDPLTKAVTEVGAFKGCSSVIDLAIDKDFKVYATSFSGLYAIDRFTAQCTLVKNGGYPNSLSFVPVGTVDPNVEALVGYNGSDYVRIDPASGNVTTIGSLGQGYASSGDIVSVIKGGTYLTVTGPGCSDCLVEVDPKSGALVKNFGSVGYTQVFGLAYWGGKAYGFSNAGELFEIAFNGSSVTSTPISIPAAPPNLKFWGAGSSTSAPISIPN